MSDILTIAETESRIRTLIRNRQPGEGRTAIVSLIWELRMIPAWFRAELVD